MKKFKPLLLVVFIAAAVAILGYAYVIFGERYGFRKTDENVNANENKTLIDNFSDLINGSNENANANLNLNENLNANENTNANTKDNTPPPTRDQISSKDCSNHCSRYKDNADDFAYCQQVCGDASITKKNSLADCVSLTGDQKDYCIKDLAVGKEDLDICNQIVDAKIKKTCKNRITEDLMN
jgi:hypothetical protein